MKTGIYLRRLSGLGGGARHTLAIAETLAKFHPTDVITHTPIDPRTVSERFNIDLSGIRIQYLPEQTWSAMSELSSQYDLFVNSLHNTYFPSRARHSAMLIFFPIPAHLPLGARIRRAAAHFLNKHLVLFEHQQGIYGEERINGQIVRWLDQQASIKLLPARRAYQVRFDLHRSTEQSYNINIRLDGKQSQTVNLTTAEPTTSCLFDIPASRQQSGHMLDIEIDGHQLLPATARDGVTQNSAASGVQLIDLRATHPSNIIYRKLFEEWFPVWRDRIENVPPHNFLNTVNTYDLLWSNSEFTRTWTQQYWQRDSNVCYPQIEVDLFQPRTKKNQILSVGRFFRGSHNKKHLVMIEAFKQMVDSGLQGWSLHLAGGLTGEALHQSYAEKVKAATVGYPIELHINAPFAHLQQLYGESKIYWHAAGHGESAAREPVKLEHFGMTTVEAMAAGGVPVVINRGGQPEIIEYGKSGFHWDTTAQLIERTQQIIADPERCEQMAQAAIVRSKYFDTTHFEQRLLASLESIGCKI